MFKSVRGELIPIDESEGLALTPHTPHIFGQDGKKLYTHIFRSVYAEIATYFYKPALIPEHQFKAEL